MDDQIVVIFASAGLGIVIGLIGFLGKKALHNVDKKIDGLKDDHKEVIKRFDQMPETFVPRREIDLQMTRMEEYRSETNTKLGSMDKKLDSLILKGNTK